MDCEASKNKLIGKERYVNTVAVRNNSTEQIYYKDESLLSSIVLGKLHDKATLAAEFLQEKIAVTTNDKTGNEKTILNIPSLQYISSSNVNVGVHIKDEPLDALSFDFGLQSTAAYKQNPNSMYQDRPTSMGEVWTPHLQEDLFNLGLNGKLFVNQQIQFHPLHSIFGKVEPFNISILKVPHVTPQSLPQLEAKLYECNNCGYTTPKQQNLRVHVKSVHIKVKPFKCEECNFSAVFPNHLRKHVTAVHLKEKSLKCTECDFMTARAHCLRNHIKCVHRGERPFKCTECDYAATVVDHLRRHVKTVHLKLKPFKCPYCDHATAQQQNLEVHIKAVHLKFKPYKCIMCDFFTARPRELKMHIQAIHDKKKPFSCTECSYTSVIPYDLKIHVKAVHLKEKSFKCSECDYSVAWPKSLKRHMKKHEENSFNYSV
uniref:Zinc finger autosomal protein-like n=1 Tax=Hirondellea gigas TaxID=1518452 RepID=A0A6A7G3U2_9CRUS